jgi:two-component system sensor histidine kinase YesM
MTKLKYIFSQLRVQMTIIIMMLVFAACFLLALLAGHLTQKALRQSAEKDTEALLSQVIRNVEYYLDDMEALGNVLNEHHSVLRMLLNTEPVESARATYYEDAKSVRSFLTDLSRLRSEIMSITIIGENGTYVGTQELEFTTEHIPPEDLSWYRLAIQNKGNPIFLPPRSINSYTGKTQHVISLVKALSLGDAPPSGAMSINLTLETLEKICTDVRLSGNGYVYIVDVDGNYIYHPDPAYLQDEAADPGSTARPITQRVLLGESGFVYDDSFVVSDSIESAGYYVVGVVPYDTIVGAANALRTIETLIGSLFAVTIALVVGLLLSYKVFHPLNVLKGVMKKARGGDMNIIAPETPHNEIGEVGTGFNAMLERIRLLISSNTQKEKEKRKAELDALQAQINPHFLYNTLDSIVWMAHYQPDIAASMADSLAKLFRLMLGGGEDFVPLSQEIEHVSEYLSIQKLRYSTKFSYQIEVESGTENIFVPKLILQPLVENAIYHGIKPARKSCALLVKTIRDGNELTLFVGDNGIGMKEEKAASILTSNDASEKHMGGIGVKNINERIALHYGEGYGISYCCVEHIGTLAVITLPTGVNSIHNRK